MPTYLRVCRAAELHTPPRSGCPGPWSRAELCGLCCSLLGLVQISSCVYAEEWWRI